MKAAVLHGPRDLRVDARADPRIDKPMDAIIRVVAARRASSSDLVRSGKIDPGKVLHLGLPIEQAAEGDRAMDERRAIKSLPRT